MNVTEPLGVRLPPDLKDRIRKSEADNRRSMNNQIVVLLERALPAETKSAEVVGATPAE